MASLSLSEGGMLSLDCLTYLILYLRSILECQICNQGAQALIEEHVSSPLVNTPRHESTKLEELDIVEMVPLEIWNEEKVDTQYQMPSPIVSCIEQQQPPQSVIPAYGGWPSSATGIGNDFQWLSAGDSADYPLSPAFYNSLQGFGGAHFPVHQEPLLAGPIAFPNQIAYRAEIVPNVSHPLFPNLEVPYCGYSPDLYYHTAN